MLKWRAAGAVVVLPLWKTYSSPTCCESLLSQHAITTHIWQHWEFYYCNNTDHSKNCWPCTSNHSTYMYAISVQHNIHRHAVYLRGTAFSMYTHAHSHNSHVANTSLIFYGTWKQHLDPNIYYKHYYSLRWWVGKEWWLRRSAPRPCTCRPLSFEYKTTIHWPFIP